MSQLTYAYLEQLKGNSPEIKLLNRDSLPLIIGFLHHEFIQQNRHSIPQSELISALGNYLFDVNEGKEPQHTQSPKDYLENWSNPEVRILRKYYPSNAEEAVFDITPSTIRVIGFLESMEAHEFVGAESRMKNLLHMFRNLAYEGETDPFVLVQEYKKQIKTLEKKIEEVRAGQVEMVDSYIIRGQLFEIQDTGKHLLYDFRQVDENFRKLDQNIREHFAISSDGKGKVLDDVFNEHDQIRHSDQGKSFRAFWEFLMSPNHQREMKDLLEKISTLPEVQELEGDDFLTNFISNLLDTGESVYQSYNLITEQLRKFLEGQVHVQNRRIIELIRDIEKQAIAVKQVAPKLLPGLSIHNKKPISNFPMSRVLFVPQKRPHIDDDFVLAGNDMDLSLDALYPEGSVDEKRLLNNIHHVLRDKASISMKELLEVFPVREGLSEVLTYFRFAAHSEVPAIIHRETLQTISWNRFEELTYAIELPEVVFLKKQDHYEKSGC